MEKSVELSPEFNLQPLSCPFCGYVNEKEPSFASSGVGIFEMTDGIKGAAYCEECLSGFFVNLKTYNPDTKKAELYFIEEYVTEWLIFLKSEKKMDYETVKKINDEFYGLCICNYTINPSEYPTLSVYKKIPFEDIDNKYGHYYNREYDQDFVKFHNLTKKYCLTYRNEMSHDDYINDKTLFNLGLNINNYNENEELSVTENSCYIKLRDNEGKVMVEYHYGK